MRHSILIKSADDTFRTYSLKSKSTLKNDFFQNKLKWLHRQDRAIKCGCRPDSDLWLAVVKREGESYFLRTYPKIVDEHSAECIFNNVASKLYDDNKEAYSLSIFQEVKEGLGEQGRLEQESILENATNGTFYSFCQEWISNANSYAFNSVNMQNEYFTDNYTYKDFISKLNKIEISVSKIGSVKNIGNIKGNFLKYGITYTDIPSMIDHTDLDKTLEIAHFGKEKGFQVTQKRLNIAAKKLQIFSNYIKPPYFFIAVLYYGVAVRLFLYPVYFDEERICFIESEFERRHAKELYDRNIAFLKPISDEYHQLNKNKAPYFDSAYRPDFFEFFGNEIDIVELSGFGSVGYLNRLADKRNDYLRIEEASKNADIKFKYKEITMA